MPGAPTTSGSGRPRVYLHVGGHKTGTTYLQGVLWRNRAALRRAGLLYPGNRQAAHIWACHDLRGTGFKSYRAPQVQGAWGRLVREIRDFGGPAVIDQEMFSLAEPGHIERAMADLSFAEVHLVFTARDMARQLPAAWQEWIKNRETLSFAEFLTGVRTPDSPAAHRLGALHDVPAILAKWSRGIPPERVHVVTVPPPGADPGTLWNRFAHVLGIAPDSLDTTVPGANASLGAAEVGVIRRLNGALTGLPQPQYDRIVKFHVAPAIAGSRGPRIELPEDAFAWALEQAKATVAALERARYEVTGDLADLIPATRPTGADPDAAPDADLADAAIAALAAAVRYAADAETGKATGPDAATRAEVRRLQAELAQAREKLRERDELAPWERVKRTGVELAGQTRWASAALGGYRRLRDRG